MAATRTPSLEEKSLLKAIEDDVPWENLSKRIKLFLGSQEEWQRRVKEYCMEKQLKWNESAARRVGREAEYYDELVRFSRKNLLLFPYHLADYVCRIMRISPFKYYCDLLFEVMRQERSYDSIPNFSAADALRETGIGRNQYIDILNKAKAKLMWKINKSFVKEMFPNQPADFPIEPWWRVNVVNLSLEEYRKLTPSELYVIEKSSKDEDNSVGEFDIKIVNNLYKRGLIYFEVPVFPYDRFQVSSLEGFISNRNLQQQDQVEELLYAMFVASSEQTTVEELCITLQVNIMQLSYVISLACRLGWAKKELENSSMLIPPDRPPSPFPSRPSSSFSSMPEISTRSRSFSSLQAPDLGIETSSKNYFFNNELSSPYASASPSSSLPRYRFAFIVDASLTSFLMMGSFSHGLKQQAVTLFEAGKLNNQSVKQLCVELKGVEGMKMEGELQRLTEHAKSLFIALTCLKLQSLDSISPSIFEPSPSPHTSIKDAKPMVGSASDLLHQTKPNEFLVPSTSSSPMVKHSTIFSTISKAMGGSATNNDKSRGNNLNIVDAQNDRKNIIVPTNTNVPSLMDALHVTSLDLPVQDISFEKSRSEWNQGGLFEAEDDYQDFQSAETLENSNSILEQPVLLTSGKVNWDQLLAENETGNDETSFMLHQKNAHRTNSFDNIPTFDHPITPSSRSNSEKERIKLEVLRSESLTNLPLPTLQRLLKRDYTVLISMAPIASPLIIPSGEEDDPAHYGVPSAAAVTPWMKLLLYASAGSGPVSVALMKGLRFRHLPPPLFGCKQALIWTWDQTSAGGLGTKPEGSLVSGSILLHIINQLLRFSSILVQPLGSASVISNAKSSGLVTCDIPLPLSIGQFKHKSDDLGVVGDLGRKNEEAENMYDSNEVSRVSKRNASLGDEFSNLVVKDGDNGDGNNQNDLDLSDKHLSEVRWESHPSIINLTNNLSLSTLGYLRMLRVLVYDKIEENGEEELRIDVGKRGSQERNEVDNGHDTEPFHNIDSSNDEIDDQKSRKKYIRRYDWIPLSLEFGMPLFNSVLCKQVCERVLRERLFEPSTLKKQKAASVSLKQQLKNFVDKYKSGGLMARMIYEKNSSLKRRISIGLDHSSALTSAVALQSPKKYSSETLNQELVRNLSEIAYISSPEPQFLKVGFVEAIHVPVKEESDDPNSVHATPEKSVKDGSDDSSPVPLLGLNLLFDGRQLVPFDVCAYLQGRIPASIVAQAK